MKLIGKQIVVELPENPHDDIGFKRVYQSALSEVAKMNQAWEVDEEAMRVFLVGFFGKSKFYNWEIIREYCEALASNPSAWMKRKDEK